MTKPVISKIIQIEDRQYMPLPANNKLVAAGPGEVEVTRYRDGTLTVRQLAGCSQPIELAIIQKWKRLTWDV